jgi:elongation factor P--(R)-beta-lysine ligase
MTDWRPSAPLAALKRRAELLVTTRGFFAARGVLEVETPLLGAHTVTDPHLESIPALPRASPPGYLQTSPEYAMKRLLAAGAPDLYQICKAFRDGERGRHHNREFTIVEWYRRGFDALQLMDEVEALLRTLLGAQLVGVPVRVSYRDALQKTCGLDPFTAGLPALAAHAHAHLGELPAGLEADRDGLLDLIVAALVGPLLGREGLCFVYDYPASQAALARLKPGAPEVAARFEAYLHGLELCNGFEELGDAAEQRRRFAQDAQLRRTRSQPVPAPDERLLGALGAGLPDCAGVALGLDRVLMLALGCADMREVIAFPEELA